MVVHGVEAEPVVEGACKPQIVNGVEEVLGVEGGLEENHAVEVEVHD